MTTPFIIYTLSWCIACLYAIYLLVRNWHTIALFQAKYWRFLSKGWKIVTFSIAAVGLTIIAPYTGDPTWDYFDAAFMSVLTFATAPWAVGILYLAFRRKMEFVQVYIAICLWLFSASWSYDMYIFLRDGFYPVAWLANMFASSILYMSGGLLWNLEWKEGRGVIFGFMDPDWFELTDSHTFRRVIWFALPFMLLTGAMIAGFFI